MQNFDKYLESLDEGKIVIKRRYTENHPEKNVRKGANIRNTIIEALRDKKLTLSEFNEIVAKHSKSPNKWTQRNKRFFTIKEDNVTLSRYGNKIAKTLQPVNEAREKPFRKVKVGDIGQDYNGEDVTIVAVGKLGKLMKYDDTGMAEDGLSQGYLNKNDDAVAVESPEGGFALFTYGDDGVAVYEGVEPGKYGNLYYDTAEKVFKRERIKIGWALIDKWLQKAHDKGHLEYTAKYGKDAEEDIRAAIDKIGKDNMKMFAYESVVNEGKLNMDKMIKAAGKELSQGADNDDLDMFIEDYLEKNKISYEEFDYDQREELYQGLDIKYGIVIEESVEINERAKATQMLKHVVKGLTTDVEGIKLSKDMAEAYLDWLKTSAYGKRYVGLPFDHIFKASFNWGIDRYTKHLKKEYKELKQKAKEMKESAIYTSFSNFVNESYAAEEEVNEAFKSSKLRNLLNMKKSPKSLMKGIYGATKIALDKVEDHQIVDVDPKQGPKQDGYVFYYTTQEKENPHAADDYYNAKFPANTLLALAKGKKVFYVRSDWSRRHGSTYSLTTDPKGGFGRSTGATDIGPNKSYSGYDASGLGSLARVISIADAAFVINPDALETTHDKIKQRSQAKEGAIAFKDHKEFKEANLSRYREILTQRSKSLDVDKEVIKAIEEVADIMKDGVKNQKKNKYNELIMGTGNDRSTNT